jgi:hypothetical protein
LRWIAGMVVLAVMLGGCASSPKSDDEIVIERAQARWDAVAAGDLETAYTYFPPGYRSSHSLIDYGVSQRVRKVHYTSATYRDHECEGSRCLVKFSVGFKVMNPVPGMSVYDSSSLIEDTWIKTDGQWWYLPKK